MSHFPRTLTICFWVLQIALPGLPRQVDAEFSSPSAVLSQALSPLSTQFRAWTLRAEISPGLDRLIGGVYRPSFINSQTPYDHLKEKGLSVEERKIKRYVTRFAEHFVKPIARTLDETNDIEIAKPALKAAAQPMSEGEPSLVSAAFEPPYGGGLGAMVESIITETFAFYSQSFALIHDVLTALTSGPIEIAGNDEQKGLFLKKLMQGGWWAGYGQTEPGIGSDVQNLETYADLSANGKAYILNGTKSYNTVGMIGDFYIVFARTIDDTNRTSEPSKQITAFLVHRNWPGVTVEHESSMTGHRGTGTATLYLSMVKVPIDHILGEKNKGFAIAMKTLERGRISITSIILGCLETTVTGFWQAYRLQQDVFVRDPDQRARWERQLLRVMADTYAARRLLMRAARNRENHPRSFWDRWFGGQEPTPLSDNVLTSMAKLYGGEKAVAHASEVLGWLGPESLKRGERFEESFRSARLLEIGEGTTEVMRYIIRRELVGRHTTSEAAAFEAAVRRASPEMLSPVQTGVEKLLTLYAQARDPMTREWMEFRMIDLLAEGLAISQIRPSFWARLWPSFERLLWRTKLQEVGHLADQWAEEAEARLRAETAEPMLDWKARVDAQREDWKQWRQSFEIFQDETVQFIFQFAQEVAERAFSNFRPIKAGTHHSWSYAGALETLLEGTKEFLGGDIPEEERRLGRAALLRETAKKDLSSAVLLTETGVADEFLTEFELPKGLGESVVAWDTLRQPLRLIQTAAGPRLSGVALNLPHHRHIQGLIVFVQDASTRQVLPYFISDLSSIRWSTDATLGLQGVQYATARLTDLPADRLPIDEEQAVETLLGLRSEALESVLEGAGLRMLDVGLAYATDRKVGKPGEKKSILEFSQVIELIRTAQSATALIPHQPVGQSLRDMADAAEAIQQVHGGLGYSTGSEIERTWRDLRMLQSLYGDRFGDSVTLTTRFLRVAA